MAFSPILVCCLLIAVCGVVTSGPIEERSANVRLNKGQARKAKLDVIRILEATTRKLKQADRLDARSADDDLDVQVNGADGAVTGEDVVSYLGELADQISADSDVQRRQLTLGYGNDGATASWTSKNKKWNVGGNYNPGTGAWGVSLTFGR